MSLPVLVSVLVACESEEEIAAEMERALRDGNTALVGVLLAAETLSHVHEPTATTARHDPDACGSCPCLTRTGLATGPFTLELDYGDSGCLPTSGLVPTALSGHATLSWDGTTATATWNGLLFGLDEPVAGSLSGEVEDDGTTVRLSATGEPAIGAQSFDLDVDLEILGEVRIDGTVVVPGRPASRLAFDDATIPLDAIGAPCPTPAAGMVRLENPEDTDKDVVVDFAKPGDGNVTVVRDDRVSEAVDWCAFRSELM